MIFAAQHESLDPAYSFKGFVGDSYEVFGGDFGFLASVAYNNVWDNSDIFTGVIAPELNEGCMTEYETFEDVEKLVLQHLPQRYHDHS